MSTPPNEQPAGGAPGGLAPLGSTAGIFGKALDDSNVIGSPLKKARPSLGAELIPGLGVGGDRGSSTTGETGGFPSALGDILAKAEAAHAQAGKGGEGGQAVGGGGGMKMEVKMEEEEL